MYMGRKHLSFPSTVSMDEVSNIEDTIDCQFSDEEEEQLKGVSISGVRDLEVIHLCVNCNKNVTRNIVTCETCNTTHDPKITAKHSQNYKLTLRATGDILQQIAQSDKVTAQDILFASLFNCTYNTFNTITSISRH